MDSSASDSRKEIACTSNLFKLCTKKNTEKNGYHSCEHFVTYLFFTFFKCKNSKESQTQSMLMP